MRFTASSMSDLWDRAISNQYKGTEEAIPPFFNLKDHDDEDEVKEWLDTAIPILESQSTDFARKCVENAMFYRGVQTEYQEQYPSLTEANRLRRTNEVSLNIVYEFVELMVNRTSSLLPTIHVIPENNEAKAREAAEAKELAIKDYFRRNNIEEKANTFARQCFTLGESYFHVRWDYDKGDLRPDFKQIESKYKGFFRVGTPSGDEVNIDRMPRVGDISVDIVPAIFVLFEDKPWESLDYIVINCPEDVFKLRSDYPDIEIDGDGEIDCYWMYHLPTRYLQKGRFVRYASGKVLENTDFPLSQPLFPVIRMTDIDVVGASRGRGFVENIKPHQVLINRSITSVWDNLRRTAKGKWVYQKKTVSETDLAPESPGIGYIGAKPPEFVAYPGIKGEALEFIRLLREYAERQARVHQVSQGAPPPNVRSGLQMAQLEEQQRLNIDITIKKRSKAYEELANVIAAFMARYYRPEDERTMRIFGKDKQHLVKAINIDALRRNSIVRAEIDNSMPTGKASQVSFWNDVRQNFGPGVVPDELMIDMLDSGRFNQFTEVGAGTVETSLAQIHMILSGEDPGDVYPYEDLVLKWKIFVGHMRMRSYLDYEEAVKEKFEEMVLTIETLIMQKAQTPLVQQQLQTLSGFPIYWTELPPEMPLEAPGAPQAQFSTQGAPEGLVPQEMAAEEAVAPQEGAMEGVPEGIPLA